MNDMILNAVWMVVTAPLLVAVAWAWPHPSWEWGLVFGSGMGAGGMMLTAQLAEHTGIGLDKSHSRNGEKSATEDT